MEICDGDRCRVNSLQTSGGSTEKPDEEYKSCFHGGVWGLDVLGDRVEEADAQELENLF